jgi:hypothetical protein
LDSEVFVSWNGGQRSERRDLNGLEDACGAQDEAQGLNVNLEASNFKHRNFREQFKSYADNFMNENRGQGFVQKLKENLKSNFLQKTEGGPNPQNNPNHHHYYNVMTCPGPALGSDRLEPPEEPSTKSLNKVDIGFRYNVIGERTFSEPSQNKSDALEIVDKLAHFKDNFGSSGCSVGNIKSSFTKKTKGKISIAARMPLGNLLSPNTKMGDFYRPHGTPAKSEINKSISRDVFYAIPTETSAPTKNKTDMEQRVNQEFLKFPLPKPTYQS